MRELTSWEKTAIAALILARDTPMTLTYKSRGSVDYQRRRFYQLRRALQEGEIETPASLREVELDDFTFSLQGPNKLTIKYSPDPLRREVEKRLGASS